MPDQIWQYCWTLAQLAEGLPALVKQSGLKSASQSATSILPTLQSEAIGDFWRWLAWSAETLGVEAEAVETTLPEVASMLSNTGPAILRLGEQTECRFLLLLGGRSGKLRVLAPDLSQQNINIFSVRNLLCQRYEAPLQREIEQILQQADLPASQRKQVVMHMLEEQLANQRVDGCWLLRLPPSASFWRQLNNAGLPKRVLWMISVFCLLYGLEIAGWGLIGHAALDGRLDFGWLTGWGLLVLSLIPLHLLAGWLDASFALDVGRLLKKRLLAGALKLELQAIKHQGAGQLLSQVLESQALESLALNGGFAVLVALIEYIFAGWILANGASGFLHVWLMLAWLTVAFGLSLRYFRCLRRWTLRRLDLTNALVERMVGHKTCLAQEPASRRVAEEDHSLNDYYHASQQADKAIIPIAGGLSRGWLILALIGLTPAFAVQSASASAMAISLGGILLANRALTSIASGLAALSRAAIAWQQVATLFHAAERKNQSHTFLTGAQLKIEANEQTRLLIDAHDLIYRYQTQGEPVLRGLNLAINKGEHVLLQGASGGGKSTLAALLTGLRTADSGLLLLNGLDRFTLGDSWRQMVSAAPQFHENHILGGTLAFNLLMGRNWPASEQDLAEAKTLCEALGLSELLDRMPSGLQQMVGETGWQLSHGERSRIFMARALLQNSPLTILDESFAALDPESLEQCLQCAFGRTSTLLVIAHP